MCLPLFGVFQGLELLAGALQSAQIDNDWFFLYIHSVFFRKDRAVCLVVVDVVVVVVVVVAAAVVVAAFVVAFVVAVVAFVVVVVVVAVTGVSSVDFGISLRPQSML